ncbi:MAG TPA: RecX family transcriptional regulator, partial [Gammaproteobacteria bacterium]|nr:RecX family transcriptional regulator [Gammaproteobacteria bacterium]
AATILQLKDNKYLDEARFIGCIIRARIGQGLGPLRILAEFKEHQIPPSKVENHEEWQKISWFDNAFEIKERRFGKITCADFKQQQKQKLFLQRRGFTLDQIRHAFSETSSAEG